MRKLFLAASLLAVSSFATAKVTYVTGKLTAVDLEHNTISIVDAKSHQEKTFIFSQAAMERNLYGRGSKVSSFKTGRVVTLRLKDIH